MDKVNAILSNPRVQRAMDNPIVRSSAAVGALLLVVRFYLARKSAGKPKLHITNFQEVARKIKDVESGYALDEFDVIVVGGGAPQELAVYSGFKRRVQVPPAVPSRHACLKTLLFVSCCSKLARGVLPRAIAVRDSS